MKLGCSGPTQGWPTVQEGLVFTLNTMSSYIPHLLQKLFLFQSHQAFKSGQLFKFFH